MTNPGNAPRTSEDHRHHGGPEAFFFYLTDRIESPKPELTGAELKELIKKAVPSFDPAHSLVLEGPGPEEDRVIKDGDTVSVEVGPHHAPKHFYSKPPTNFGAC